MTTAETIGAIVVCAMLALVFYYVIKLGYQSVVEYEQGGENLGYVVFIYVLAYAALLIGVGAMVWYTVSPHVLRETLSWTIVCGILGTVVFGVYAVHVHGARRLTALLALYAAFVTTVGALVWHLTLS